MTAERLSLQLGTKQHTQKFCYGTGGRLKKLLWQGVKLGR